MSDGGEIGCVWAGVFGIRVYTVKGKGLAVFKSGLT